MSKVKTKPKPKWMKNSKSYLHPKNNNSFLIAAIAVLLIAAGVFAFFFAVGIDYYTAKYKETVTATLVNVREFEKIKSEYYDDDVKPNDNRYHATYTYSETYHELTWEYKINGKKYTTKNTEAYPTQKVGDTKEIKLWSNDGKNYKISQIGIITFLILILSGAIALVMLFFTVRIIIAKIQVKAYEKRKAEITRIQEENRLRNLKKKEQEETDNKETDS